jgi:flagellar hook-length control protein FliK
MAAELGSIATKALEKKNGKNIGLNALLKLGIDDKAFADKLSKALQNTDSKGLRPMVLDLKKEVKTDKNDSKTQAPKKEIKQEHKSVDDAREFLFKQAISTAKLSKEVNVEKAIKELRDFAKGDKKLSDLLDKVEKSGLKAKIAVEKVDETGDTKHPKETKKVKKVDEQAPQAPTKEVKKEEPKVVVAEPTTKDELAAKAKNDQNKKVQDAKDAQDAADIQTKNDKNTHEAKQVENAKPHEKKSEEKVETKPALTPQNQQVTQKKDEKDSEEKVVVKDQKAPKVEAQKEEVKKELVADNTGLKQLPKDNTLTPTTKTDEKFQVVSKKEEKPLDLMQLLAGLEDVKIKKDDSLTPRGDKESKEEKPKDGAQEKLAQTSNTSSAQSIQGAEEDIGQKIRDAAVTIKNFAEDLRDKIDEYKPPLMKVSMELRPDNMPPVDVTMITRGQNLIVNINSGEEALKMFLNNATDFRQNLMDIGFTEMTMNFNFKDQNGEKKQYQFNEQKAKKYQDIEEISMGITDIEVIVPRYA